MPIATFGSVDGTVRRCSMPTHLRQRRQQVDRQHVHEIHQEHPETDEQRRRRHEAGAVVIGVLDLRIDDCTHSSMKFCHLPGTPLVALRAARRNMTTKISASTTEKQERIQMQHPEAAGFRIDAHRVQIQLEVGQVVQDVAAGVVVPSVAMFLRNPVAQTNVEIHAARASAGTCRFSRDEPSSRAGRAVAAPARR
jgi:hypothetical protein